MRGINIDNEELGPFPSLTASSTIDVPDYCIRHIFRGGFIFANFASRCFSRIQQHAKIN